MASRMSGCAPRGEIAQSRGFWSAGVRRPPLLGPALAARALLLGLGKAKPCLCLLVGSLQLAQSLRAGRARAEGSRLVQLIALSRVPSLNGQIIQVLR